MLCDRIFYSRVKALLLGFAVLTSVVSGHYAPGPVFLPLKFRLADNCLLELQRKLDTALIPLLGDEKFRYGCDSSTDSWAIQLTAAGESLWSSFHTATDLQENKHSRQRSVNGDTVFRVASISKTFTVYSLLLESSVNLEDPITKYIPELMDRESKPWLVQWDQVTLKSLAGHLSGMARDSKCSLKNLQTKHANLQLLSWRRLLCMARNI
jgi:Beta-lactamase